MSATRHEIPPRSGTAFTLRKGDRLTVIDPRGEQVADLLAFAQADLDEVFRRAAPSTTRAAST